MALNLLTDPWIPVIEEGKLSTIRPDQITDCRVTRLAWPRGDFNLACLELLVGLVSLADPPSDDTEWERQLIEPNPDQFRKALLQFASYFHVDGEGPRFMQDFEKFERSHAFSNRDVLPVDTLFIDSPGKNTISDNKDLTVRRGRYTTLSPEFAAMAIYTLQTYAPSGGQGHRVSLRGGGPMTTLIQPVSTDTPLSLWRLVYSNVLPRCQQAHELSIQALPWLRATRTSDQGQEVTPKNPIDLEAYFATPRRIRLIFDEESVIGVVQKVHGPKYETWEHPLSPYYRKSEQSSEWLPRHPKPGRLSYRNWLGVTMKTEANSEGTKRLARTVRTYINRSNAPQFELIVGGWSMDNMKPKDFSLHVYPGFTSLSNELVIDVHKLVDVAGHVERELKNAFKAIWHIEKANSASIESLIEEFYLKTEESFNHCVGKLISNGNLDFEENWFKALRTIALLMYDEHALAGMTDRNIGHVSKLFERRKQLQRKLSNKLLHTK